MSKSLGDSQEILVSPSRKICSKSGPKNEARVLSESNEKAKDFSDLCYYKKKIEKRLIN